MTDYRRTFDIEYVKLELECKAGIQDLRRSMVKIVIFEDMYANGLTCEVILKDSEAFQEILPIVGDEILHLHFRSAKIQDNPFPLIKLDMPIKSIENKIAEEGSVKQFFTMTFMSKTTAKNLDRRMCRHYNDLESNIASDIFTNVLNVSNFETELSKYTRNIVIPNWQPYQTLDYLAKVAVRPSNYPASNYMWWEDRDKFYFKSLDKIMEEGAKFKLVNEITAANKWDDAPNFKKYNVSGIRAVNTFNDMTNTGNGLWAKEFIGHDIIKRKLTKHKWLYDSEWSASVQIDGKNEKLRTDYPTNTYVNQDFEPWQEGAEEYNNWHHDDSSKRRLPMMQQFDNYKFICSMPGDTNIRMGVVCEVDLPSMSHRRKNKLDDVLKGNWLVTRIRHELNQRTHQMMLEIRKPHLKSFGIQQTIDINS